MKRTILSIATGLAFLTGTTVFATAKDNNKSTTVKNEKTAAVAAASTEATVQPTKDGYLINYESEGKKGTSSFDKQGNLIYTILRYGEDKLSSDVRDLVTEDYVAYTITGVDQVTQPGSNLYYLVHIENNDSFKVIKVSNNETAVVQDLRK